MTEVSVAYLLDRPVYGLAQVDVLLGTKPGTARRWIDGYRRGGRVYPPVIRSEPTGDEVVTWGEFVEARLLAEYRSKGVPLVRMRPVVEALRERLGTKYPLAHEKPFAAGRELVSAVQEDVGLDPALRLVVIRNNQQMLALPAENFVNAVEFADNQGPALRLRPIRSVQEVVIDPLRQFGEPSVRSVPTAIIAELVRAGDSPEMIAELYDLAPTEVQAAIRFELTKAADQAA